MTRKFRLAQRHMLQTNFAGGQLDAAMRGRVDTQIYAAGAENLYNFALLMQGGVRRRPGLERLANLPDNITSIRSCAFLVSFDDTYVVLLYATGTTTTFFRVYTDDGVAAGSAIAAPYTEAELSQVRWAQRADTMIFAHENHQPRVLTRTGTLTFSLSLFTFFVDSVKTRQPYYKYAASNVTLIWSGTQLTASASVFTSAYVGLTIEKWDEAALKMDYFNITGYTSGTVVTATKLGSGTHDTTLSTLLWAEPAFSNVRGWPRTLAFHGQRLWFGGSKYLPSHLFSSSSSRFFDFWVGEGKDDESIQIPIASDQIADIMHLASLRNLLIFTDHKQLYVPQSTSQPVTPQNVQVSEANVVGCTRVRPVPMERSLIMQQPIGVTVRECFWNDVIANFEANPVNLQAIQLADNFVDMAGGNGSEEAPELYLYAVRQDGRLSVMQMNKAENKTGWTSWKTRGDDQFKAVSVVYDRPIVVSRRQMGASTKWFLERFTYEQTLDCANTFVAGAPTQVFTDAFPHLANREVDVTVDAGGRANAYHLGKFTIGATGTLNISSIGINFQTVHAGFNYEAHLKTLPVTGDVEDGDLSLRKKRINKIIVQLWEALSVELEGNDILFRFSGEDLEDPPAPQSGSFEFARLGWDRLGQVSMAMKRPLNGSILSITTEVSY